MAECPANLYKLIRDYFCNRYVFVTAKQNEVRRMVDRGCPQGSILGPLFWNMIFDELLDLDMDAYKIAYADDLLLLINGNSRSELEGKANKILQKLSEWCGVHKLQVAENKTVAMLIKGKLSSNRFPSIKVNKKQIKFVEEVKYLDVVVDRNLNFVKHAEYINKKVKTIFAKLVRVTVRLGFER